MADSSSAPDRIFEWVAHKVLPARKQPPLLRHVGNFARIQLAVKCARRWPGIRCASSGHDRQAGLRSFQRRKRHHLAGRAASLRIRGVTISEKRSCGFPIRAAVDETFACPASFFLARELFEWKTP